VGPSAGSSARPTQFIHNLAGNTQLTTQVRQVTKAVNPKLRQWTSLDCTNACVRAYEIYDTILIRLWVRARVRRLPLVGPARVAGRMVVYDEAFRLWTLPTTAAARRVSCRVKA
jgi:hypothetical protein